MNNPGEWRKQVRNVARPWWLQARSLAAGIGCTAMVAVSACTTMHTVDPQAEPAASSSIEAGETIVVSQRDGRASELSFVGWTADGLTGTDEDGILRTIAREDIVRLEVQRTSAVRSVGLGVAVAGFMLGILAAASCSGHPYC